MASSRGVEPVISESMVQIIFTPIKESLAATTAAIHEASQQVRDLARLYTTPPVRGDIITHITSLVDKHDNNVQKIHDQIKICIKEAVSEHQDDVLTRLTLEYKDVTKAVEHVNSTLKDNTKNTEKVDNSIQDMKTEILNLNSKISNLLTTISVIFGILTLMGSILFYYVSKEANNYDAIVKILYDQKKDEKPGK